MVVAMPKIVSYAETKQLCINKAFVSQVCNVVYGVAGGKDDGVIFSKGEPLRKVERDEIFDALFEEIEKDGWK